MPRGGSVTALEVLECQAVRSTRLEIGSEEGWLNALRNLIDGIVEDRRVD